MKKRKKKLLLLVLLFSVGSASICLATGGINIFLEEEKKEVEEAEEKKFDVSVDKNAKEGGLEKRNEEEIQKKLNEKVSNSMINISMNMTPTFKNGKSEGNLSIVNEDINNYMQVVEIYLKDNNKLIYTSGGIPVGNKIETARLDVNLSKGIYESIAYFNAVDEKTGNIIGKAGAEIKITILN